MLWGGKFWTSGFYVNTVGNSGNEDAIKRYVQKQSQEYKQLHRQEPEEQLALFSY
jgi:putative transposase